MATRGKKTQGAEVAPLRSDVHRQLSERILDGDIAPGAHINESRLATELKVSRTPLREALFLLEREGFVTSSRDRGFFAAPLREAEVRETYPIIAALEGLAVRSSGPRLVLSVAELKKINNQLKRTASPRKAIALDGAWHETLISSSPNRKLKELIASLRLLTRRYEILFMKDDSLIDVSYRQHSGILEAIEANDIEVVLNRLTENWTFGMEVVLLRLGSQQ
jgi:DNA-binding GntR family transcriptional regulator